MARTTTLERQEVFDAIRVLLASGEYPTSARLREQLDRRGSPVVLQRFLADWYAEFGPELARKAGAKPPKNATDGLQAELKRLTASAVQEVEAAQAERVALLDGRSAGLDALEQELIARGTRLDQREQDLSDWVATAAAESKEAVAAAAVAKAELAAQLAIVEQLKGQAEEQGERISQLMTQLRGFDVLKSELVTARAEHDRLQGQILEMTASGKDLLSRLDQARAETARIHEEARKDREAHAATSATLIARMQDLATYTAEIERLTQLHAAAVAENDRWERTLNDRERLIQSLRNDLDALNRQTALKDRELAAAQADKDAFTGRIAVLEADLAAERGRQGERLGAVEAALKRLASSQGRNE